MLRKFVKGVQKLQSAYKDTGLNRKLVGYDRSGNGYYQYYNSDGSEGKRQMEPNKKTEVDYRTEYDPYWDEWLRGKQKIPFTEKELKKLWDEEDKRVEVAYAYEKKDAEMMKDFREKGKTNYFKSAESEKEEGESEKFKPGAWKPSSRRSYDQDNHNE